jgi:hypothetical protein
MDISKWFKAFIEHYREIVDSKYADRREIFPFYPPIDISVYTINDSRKIFPEIVAFFDSGIDEEFAASNLVRTEEKIIEWPEDFDSLEGLEREIAMDNVWHETFYEETTNPGVFTNEAFSFNDLSSKPKDKALIFVQKHLILDQQRDHFDAFLKLSEIRKATMGTDGLEELQTNLLKLKEMNDKDKASLLSSTLWVMGFEVVNLESLKEKAQFKKLQQIPHVDIIAFLVDERVLVAIEEGELNKERWYKLHTMEATLKTLGFFGKKEDWQISFVAIGRKSKGVDYLEGNVQVISVDYFRQILIEYIEKKSWAPALSAIRKILGYNIDFFKIKT